MNCDICFPGLLISIYPFIKAWLNINHFVPTFGESDLFIQLYKIRLNFFQMGACFEISSRGMLSWCVNSNLSQGTSECTPRLPTQLLIRPQRRWEEKVCERFCFLTMCGIRRFSVLSLLVHRELQLLFVDNKCDATPAR